MEYNDSPFVHCHVHTCITRRGAFFINNGQYAAVCVLILISKSLEGDLEYYNNNNTRAFQGKKRTFHSKQKQ